MDESISSPTWEVGDFKTRKRPLYVLGVHSRLLLRSYEGGNPFEFEYPVEPLHFSLNVMSTAGFGEISAKTTLTKLIVCMHMFSFAVDVRQLTHRGLTTDVSWTYHRRLAGGSGGCCCEAEAGHRDDDVEGGRRKGKGKHKTFSREQMTRCE